MDCRILNLLSVLLPSLSLSLSPLFFWQVQRWHERPLRLTKFPNRAAALSSVSYKSDANDIPSSAPVTLFHLIIIWLVWVGHCCNCCTPRTQSFSMPSCSALCENPLLHHLSLSIYSSFMFPSSSSLLSITPGSLPLM